MKKYLPILFALALCVALAAAASACPMCKDSTGTSEAGVTRGFGHSVYLMFGGFFTALGIIGWNLSKAIRGK